MIEQKDEFLPGIQLAVDRTLAQINGPQVSEINARLEALQTERLEKANSKQGVEYLADVFEALQTV